MVVGGEQPPSGAPATAFNLCTTTPSSCSGVGAAVGIATAVKATGVVEIIN